MINYDKAMLYKWETIASKYENKAIVYKFLSLVLVLILMSIIVWQQGKRIDLLELRAVTAEERLQEELDNRDYTIEAVYDVDELLRAKYRMKNRVQSERWAGYFVQAADKYTIPVKLLLSMAFTESRFDPYAVSWVDARGLFQVMPFWVRNKEFQQATGITRVDQLYDPAANIEAAAYILSYYIALGGSVEKGVAGYHGGPRGQINPRASTVDYVDKVLNVHFVQEV